MTALNANTSANALAMAAEIFGTGFTINSATYSGDNDSSGTYSNGDTTNPNVLPSDTGVILSTGDVSDFGNATGANNQGGGTGTNTSGVNGDADFNAAAGGATFDAAFLEVNFTPLAGQTSLNIEFRFYSEEYNEYVYSNFNDVALIMIDGVQVPISVGTGDISVNSINNAGASNPQFGNQNNDPNPGNGTFDSSNPNLYIDNTNGAFDTEMDGFTVTLSLDIPVTPGVAQTLKIGIADKGDAAYDSALVIAGNTNTTGMDPDPIAADDSGFQTWGTNPRNVDILANDSEPDGQTLTITQINGQTATVGSPITLNNGDTVTLLADGTIDIVNTSGGTEGTSSFSYTVSDPDGNTDSAFVTYDTQAPCFTPGTMIDTPYGPRAIETLAVGDLVLTRDGGPKALRWVGKQTVDLHEYNAHLRPILIRKDAFGPGSPARDMRVSPQHRMLLGDTQTQLLFGMEEALAPAKSLINHNTVLIDHGVASVTYLHLLFDEHEIVLADDAPTESLFPGEQALDAFSDQNRSEVFDLFPELRAMPANFGPTVRTVLRAYEGQVWTQASAI
ncbi:MAG: Hint domain-containing protein [Pseudomonadota bacterium]